MKIIGAVVTLLAVVLAVDADCRIVQRQRAVYVNDYAALVAVPVIVPTYTFTYGGGGDTSGLGQRIEALEKRIEQLTAALEQQATQPAEQKPAEKPAEQQPVDVLKLFGARCAACHDKSVAAQKGKGFALLDGPGKFAQLNFKQLMYVGSKTFLGSMPPGKDKLTDEEVGAVQAWLDGIK